MSADRQIKRQAARRPTTTSAQPSPDNVGSRLVGASQLLTGVGTLLAGLAAIVAIVLSSGGGPGGDTSDPSIPIASSTEPSATSLPSPLLTPGQSPGAGGGTILFRDSLHGLVPGMFEGVYGGCTHRFDAGYHVAVVAREEQGLVCADGLEDVAPALELVTSVEVEATVWFLDSVPSTSTVVGPGDAGIHCRMRGQVNTGDYYIASLSPTGYWEIDRYEAGQQKVLDYFLLADLATEPGGSRRIGLECLGDPGARTVLRFSVDGRIVGSVVDEIGLAAGSVGLGATAYAGGRLEVAFEDLEVAAR